MALLRLLGILCFFILLSGGFAQTNRAKAPSSAGKGSGAPGLLASVAISPDGRTIAAGGDKEVLLIDSERGQIRLRLGGHAGPVTAVQFSPDGKRLAAAGGLPGREGEIRIWNLSTPAERRGEGERGRGGGKTSPPINLRPGAQRPLILTGHNDAIYAIAFSPDGRRLAAASYDRLVSLWNLPPPPTQRPLILKDHTDAVYSVAFSPDGRLVASAAGDRTVKVWSAATGRRLYTLSEATAELYAVAFSPDGRRIAAGGADKTLRIWNVTAKGGALARAAFAHEGAILQVVFSPDGRSLLTAGEDRAVKRWDAATLAEQKVYPKQPDWPQGVAVSRDSRWLAVARHNGSLAVYDLRTGRLLRELLAGRPVAQRPIGQKSAPVPTTSVLPGRRSGDQRQRRPPGTGGATLFPSVLSGIAPPGAPRGERVQFTLSGARIREATGVFFDDPAITGKIVASPDQNEGLLRVETTIGPTARIGIHRVFVQTPLGTTGSVPFAVGDWPEVDQREPNNTPETAQAIRLPCTVVGTMDPSGDTDCYRFEVQAGEEIVFEVVAQPIRSRLQPVLTLMDSSGRTLAESEMRVGRSDTMLGYRFEKAGTYAVRLRDYENAAGRDVHYRLHAGAFPCVTEVFPMGVQRGATASVEVRGFNLGGVTTASVQAPPETSWGRTIALQMQTPGGPLLLTRRLHVGEDPEVMRKEGNETPDRAQPVRVPVAINGRLWGVPPTSTQDSPPAALSHYYRFAARKGQPLIVEVMARRLGAPLDSEIEILDAQGRPVERAVLRAVSQTELVLSDRDSASGGFRLQSWDGFHINDFLLAGREVVQIVRLPNGPDEDVALRTYRGQRLGFFGTTPEFHSVGAPVYKVEVHPPGRRFSPNGYPLTRLYYRNDDGGPLYGKDSYLEFDPPADGDYIVRLSDTRGQQQPDFVYRLLIHPPRPDYRLAMSPEHPNVPKGGAVPVDIVCERYDGFRGPIEVSVTGLPPGFSCTSSVIEEGENSATLLLSAAPDAVTPKAEEGSGIRVVGRARINGQEVMRTIEPDNGLRLITALPAPDILVSTDRREVVIRPGQETVVEAFVDRQGDFGARVPLEVRNLPFGVRVLDVGLNGVLVTEQDTSRRFTLYCEPWVRPQTRSFYVVGVVEGGTNSATPPLTLVVEPDDRPASGGGVRPASVETSAQRAGKKRGR